MSVRVATNTDVALTVPETATPIDKVLVYTIVVAGVNLDVRVIYDHFRHNVKFTRQDVKDFIEANKPRISGLEDLEKAILEKRGAPQTKRIVVVVYDEIIDKMVTAEWLSFHAGLSPEFEIQLIEEWAKATA